MRRTDKHHTECGMGPGRWDFSEVLASIHLLAGFCRRLPGRRLGGEMGACQLGWRTPHDHKAAVVVDVRPWQVLHAPLQL